MRNMKHTMKKLLTLALAVVIAVTFMPPMAMEAFADTGSELTLTLAEEGKTSYVEGEPIKVKASGTADGAWVGLYKKGDAYGADVLSYRWFYVADYNGSAVDITKSSFKNTPDRGSISAGEYEIVLFGDEGYNNIVKKIGVTVTPDPNKEPETPADELSLKLADEAKTTYKMGEAILICATGTASGAWVGLYAAGDAKDPENGGVTSRRWFYCHEQNGKTVDISMVEFDGNNWGSLGEGAYEIVLFGDGGYTNILKTINITIEGIIDIDTSQFTLETDKTEYKYGEPIKVKATGTGIGDGAWVGLYYAGVTEYTGAFLYYYYVKNYEDIFTTIQDRTAADSVESVLSQGDYVVVLFADGGYNFPVLKKEIKIIRDALTTKVIRNAGCTTFGLEYVEYVDGDKEYREVQPKGHNFGEIKHVSGTSTHKQVCNRSGCGKAKIEKCTLGEGTLTKAATKAANGERSFVCSVCNGVTTETIAKLKAAPKLAATSFVYNGKNRKPVVNKVYDANGKALKKGTDYTVTYPSKCKNVGTYKVTVKFKGDYTGTYKLSYMINPKAVTLNKLTKGKKSIKATWKKAAAQVTGYRIAYSTSKNFKNAKYVKVKGIKKTSATIKKLKAKKKYYVKIRAYKTLNGKTYYSAWSKAKYVTTK